MKPLALFLAIAISVPQLVQRVTRETNSHAAASRGVTSYGGKQYGEAAQSFGTASALVPSPQNSFNFGTAQIAAGKYAEGAATIEKAMVDPSLRAAALFNRGNSALAAKSYEHAIRDYSETLKLRPSDAAAKRNLEIALARKQAQEQSQSGQKNQQGNTPQPQPSQSPSAGDEGEQQQQEADTESLLRSVQQQEQEEMQRMKRARARSVRVGW